MADRQNVPSAVLITGCSSGLGAQMSRTLAAAGYRVFAGMRDVASKNAAPARTLRDWAETEGAQLEVVEIDVTSTVSVQGAVAMAHSLQEEAPCDTLGEP
jgi:NAD(P)-dependent dehydrogenase (short-subunit alcohol dehydrogenase family)